MQTTKFALYAKLRHMPDEVAITHNIQDHDCRQLAKFNRQLEEGEEVENTSQIRKENYAGQRSSSQRSYADQNQFPSAQYQYYDVQPPYTSPYPIQQPMVQRIGRLSSTCNLHRIVWDNIDLAAMVR
jgi:hypothetical protein